MGEIGLSVPDFYNLTPRNYQNLVKGYLRKEERKQRNSWEQTREIIYFNYLLTATKGQKKRKEQIFPLAWDNPIKTQTYKPRTQKELKEWYHKNVKKQ